MSFAEAAKASRIIETVENYGVSADTQIEEIHSLENSRSFYTDDHFWDNVLQNPEGFWNTKLNFHNVVISDWVARVPGLFWLKESKKYRNVPVTEIEFKSDKWITYTPQGKSGKVMGGIGTFVLPPDDEGKVIMTISYSNNASTGIPVLVFPEVIEYHKIKQGDSLQINDASWRKMSLEWSAKFQSVAPIKRGYLVIDKAEQVKVALRDQPVEFHPCTIMEYQAGYAILYDFVFCTIDSQYKNYKKEVEVFFEEYRKKNERYGKYLLAADSNDALFEAEYNSPSELLRSAPDGRSQLNLIVERIQNSFYHQGETIRSIMEKIPKYYPTAQEIMALAVRINIPQASIQTTSASKMSSQLVDICVERKMLETLVVAVLKENPKAIN